MECPKCESNVENKASGFWLGFLGKAAFRSMFVPVWQTGFSDFNEDTRKEISIQRIICRVLFFALLIFTIYRFLKNRVAIYAPFIWAVIKGCWVASLNLTKQK
jgi:uncharacterized BrkB/YihY/UPF0761 family membrane protein